MQFQNSSKIACDDPAMLSLGERNNQDQYSKAIIGLQEIRDMAWHKAVKYRFDPVIGKMHAEYLEMLNNLVKELAA